MINTTDILAGDTLCTIGYAIDINFNIHLYELNHRKFFFSLFGIIPIPFIMFVIRVFNVFCSL